MPTCVCAALCVHQHVLSPGQSTSVAQGAVTVGQLRGSAQQGPHPKTLPVRWEQQAPWLCRGTSPISSPPVLAGGETEALSSMSEGVSCLWPPSTPWSWGVNQVCTPAPGSCNLRQAALHRPRVCPLPACTLGSRARP